MHAVSSRELEKVALGIHLPALALKGLNDCYIPGGETEPAHEQSQVYRKMCASIAKADRATKVGMGSTSLLMAILFKQDPDEASRQFLLENEWFLKMLPRNPHMSTPPCKSAP